MYLHFATAIFVSIIDEGDSDMYTLISIAGLTHASPNNKFWWYIKLFAANNKRLTICHVAEIRKQKTNKDFHDTNPTIYMILGRVWVGGLLQLQTQCIQKPNDHRVPSECG